MPGVGKKYDRPATRPLRPVCEKIHKIQNLGYATWRGPKNLEMIAAPTARYPGGTFVNVNFAPLCSSFAVDRDAKILKLVEVVSA